MYPACPLHKNINGRSSLQNERVRAVEEIHVLLIDGECTEMLTFGRRLTEAKMYVSKDIDDFLLGAD